MNRSTRMIMAAFVIAICAGFFVSSLTAGREKPAIRPAVQKRPVETVSLDLPLSMQPAPSGIASEVDTFLLVHYDFEQMNWLGWTPRDNTSPHGSLHEYARLWHVEDFLEPAFAGRAAPLEGTRSMWCGALPASDEFMCGWQSAPGYGNNWNQVLAAYHIKRCSPLEISFLLKMDIEDGKDFLYLESEMMYDGYQEAARFTGQIDSAVTVTIPGAYLTKLRFRFETDDSGSDQDGLYTSYCSVTLDSIYMESLGEGLEHFDDFESYDDGDVFTNRWACYYPDTYGAYGGLENNLTSKDPCNINFGTQIVFYQGSAFPSAAYPGLFDTPYCYSWYDEASPCQDEMVVSPPIDISRYSAAGDEHQDSGIPPEDLPLLGGSQLRFTVYRDLPLDNLVFYQWKVRGIVDGCPGAWQDRGLVYHGDEPEFFFGVEEIGDLVDADAIQVGLGVVDMCKEFFETQADCETHTPAPWFDNVSVVRYKNAGPQWYVDDIHLFQDNFPSAFDMESFIRADMAMDIRPAGDPVIDPGDSIVVSCNSPTGGGIAVDAFGPRVYMHVKCGYIGTDGLKSDLSGSSLEGNMGTYIGDDGTWTIIQADSARIGSNTPAPDRYAFDLNDSLFTRGYMIEYYFKAYDNTGISSTLPPDSETAGDYPYFTGSHHFEFTCLPTLNEAFLYVDGYDGIGSHEGIVQLYFETAFDAAFAGYPGDRFDRLGPLSGTANSLASRVLVDHLCLVYDGIYWDCGDLSRWTVPDGDLLAGNKSDDCQLLIEYLDLSAHRVGIVLAGSDLATEMDASASLSATSLMADWAGISVLSGSYVDLTGGYGCGGVVNPLMTGINCLSGIEFYLYGGCPELLGFGVFEKSASASFHLAYPDHGESSYYAAVVNDTTNSTGYPAAVISLGFSFKDIRNGGLQMARNELVQRLLRSCALMGPSPDEDITGAGIPAAYSLSQNYPNPFNPSTTIRFALKTRGRVKLRVYDVTGRLVTTLVDEVRDAGYYDEVWTGRNGRGGGVASGIYFLKMESGEYSNTKKIVMLK